MTIKLRSPVFQHNEKIPIKYTGDGDNVSPPLEWEDLPPGTKEVALICDDPDAPREEPFVHWVAYGLKPTSSKVPEHIPKVPELETPIHGLQGQNSWDEIGYSGPKPPSGHGVHHYNFHIYASGTELDLAPGATKSQVLERLAGNILEATTLTGLYQRD